MPPSRLAAARHPLIWELNTWPWLHGLGVATGRRVDLASVPDAEWDRIADLGVDAVWLMGVWERSPAGRAIALADDGLVTGFREALPDLDPADVVGSPYSVRRYVVDDHLGGPDGLAAARRALRARGIGLLLDFVPNHVAIDHPWTREHPDDFVCGTDDDLARNPRAFVRVGDRVLANGRDPSFPAWTDVVQLNPWTPGMRRRAVAALRGIAAQCDGVRCDMAMLALDDVVERTWGDRAGRPLDQPFWDEVVPAVRADHAAFLFVAEVYWDREAELLAQGFDLCYDKRLYDLLRDGDGRGARDHLAGTRPRPDGLLRFLENHDEPRAAATFDPDRYRAALLTALTAPGGMLLHDGQLDGAATRVPVQLGRAPVEPADEALAAWHRDVLRALDDPTLRTGRSTPAHVDDGGTSDLIARAWDGDPRWLVVVNLGDAPAAARVVTGWADLRGSRCRLADPTTGEVYDRSGDELADGLHVELGPWRWHLFRVAVTGRRAAP